MGISAAEIRLIRFLLWGSNRCAQGLVPLLSFPLEAGDKLLIPHYNIFLRHRQKFLQKFSVTMHVNRIYATLKCSLSTDFDMDFRHQTQTKSDTREQGLGVQCIEGILLSSSPLMQPPFIICLLVPVLFDCSGTSSLTRHKYIFFFLQAVHVDLLLANWCL